MIVNASKIELCKYNSVITAVERMRFLLHQFETVLFCFSFQLLFFLLVIFQLFFCQLLFLFSYFFFSVTFFSFMTTLLPLLSSPSWLTQSSGLDLLGSILSSCTCSCSFSCPCFSSLPFSSLSSLSSLLSLLCTSPRSLVSGTALSLLVPFSIHATSHLSASALAMLYLAVLEVSKSVVPVLPKKAREVVGEMVEKGKEWGCVCAVMEKMIERKEEGVKMKEVIGEMMMRLVGRDGFKGEGVMGKGGVVRAIVKVVVGLGEIKVLEESGRKIVEKVEEKLVICDCVKVFVGACKVELSREMFVHFLELCKQYSANAIVDAGVLLCKHSGISLPLSLAPYPTVEKLKKLTSSLHRGVSSKCISSDSVNSSFDGLEKKKAAFNWPTTPNIASLRSPLTPQMSVARLAERKASMNARESVIRSDYVGSPFRNQTENFSNKIETPKINVRASAADLSKIPGGSLKNRALTSQKNGANIRKSAALFLNRTPLVQSSQSMARLPDKSYPFRLVNENITPNIVDPSCVDFSSSIATVSNKNTTATTIPTYITAQSETSFENDVSPFLNRALLVQVRRSAEKSSPFRLHEEKKDPVELLMSPPSPRILTREEKAKLRKVKYIATLSSIKEDECFPVNAASDLFQNENFDELFEDDETTYFANLNSN